MKGNTELFERLWLILIWGEEKKELSLCQRKAKTNLYKKEETNSRIHNKETERVSSSGIPICSMIFFISFGGSHAYCITNKIITF